jgi:hypothetical protein
MTMSERMYDPPAMLQGASNPDGATTTTSLNRDARGETGVHPRTEIARRTSVRSVPEIHERCPQI